MVGAYTLLGVLGVLLMFGLLRDKHPIKRIRSRRCTRQWKKFECYHKALDETLDREWQRLNS
jgi:hypothetical protein